MKNSVLLFASAICLSMLGCSLEGNSCNYSDNAEKNEYHCKNSNTSESCQTDGLWGQEVSCQYGCDTTSGRCIDSYDCDKCQLGCNTAGTGCAICNANKCLNGNLRLCKADKMGLEEPTECPLGCNPEGTACKQCDANKCENGKLSLCKADKSDYEPDPIDCPLGCIPEGTACKECDANKCENGKLSLCKDDKSGYKEESTDCVIGCNEDGTDCDNSCTDDVCKDGYIYHCNNGKLSIQGEECPELMGDIAGSCANANKCKECDENSSERRCSSLTKFNNCQNGLWSESLIECPTNQICDTNNCTPNVNNCVNIFVNNNEIGHKLTTVDGITQATPCHDSVSCNEDHSDCGECLNDTTVCESNRIQSCVLGKWKSNVCGYGCYDNTQCNVCPKDTIECKNSTLRTCLGPKWEEKVCEYGCGSDKACSICKPGTIECVYSNDAKVCSDRGEWNHISCPGGCSKEGCFECVPDSKQCNANDVQICNKQGKWEKSETCEKGCTAGACNECTVAENECKDDTLKTCENGKLVIDNCQGLGCYNSTKCNVCPLNYSICGSNNTTIRTCIGDGFYESPCPYKCYYNGYQARCLAECDPGQVECVAPNNAKICNEEGKWEGVSCSGGCNNSICNNAK